MTDIDELRALQRKAYGREGALTRAEAARLRELQQARPSFAPDPAPPMSDVIDPVIGMPAPAPDRPASVEEQLGFVAGKETDAALDTDASGEAAASAPATEPRAPESRASGALLRRHWRLVTVSTVLLLVTGLGIGWLVFGPVSTAIALTADEQTRRATLEDESDFDPGTLRAAGRDDDLGAIAWLGTKGDGDLTCAVIDVGEETQSQCQRTTDFEDFGVNVSVMLPGETVDEVTAVFTSINVYIVLSSAGVPMAAFQQWDSSSSILAQFVGEERTRAEELVESGFEMNLTIVGYFQEAPVWMANRYGETVEPETCLIVDADGGDPVCLPSVQAIEDGLSLVFVDASTGASAGTLTLAFTAGQTPYLTITESTTASTG